MVQQMMPLNIEGNAETVGNNRQKLKHIGKLKDSGANVAIIFRTVPDEPEKCLVIGPKFLDNNYHDTFMKVLESSEGQDSFELGNFLARSRFTDGVEMLAYLHSSNYLKKMDTTAVVVTMGAGNEGEIQLSELNKLIAKERNVKVSELAFLESDEKVAKVEETTKKADDSKKKKTEKKK